VIGKCQGKKKKQRTPLHQSPATSLPLNRLYAYGIHSNLSYKLPDTLLTRSQSIPQLSVLFNQPLSHSYSSRMSRSSRPTTPLRRISSHSLRSLSLSHSQSHQPSSSSESALSHLSPLFAELADSISDLCANSEGLSQLTGNLTRFNEGFASYLYGVRINSYTFDFNNVNTPPFLSLS